MFSDGCTALNLADNANLRTTKMFANVRGNGSETERDFRMLICLSKLLAELCSEDI